MNIEKKLGSESDRKDRKTVVKQIVAGRGKLGLWQDYISYIRAFGLHPVR
jgi:hypothetical protein